MNPETSQLASDKKKPAVNPFLITAGLLRKDLRILPSLLLLLSFCAVAETLVRPTFWLMAIDRILQLSVMSLVVIRWRKRLQTALSPSIRVTTVVFRIFCVGLSLWSLVTLAKTLTIASQASLGATDGTLPMLLGLGILALALLWCLRLYFYYVIAGFIGGTWRDVISRSLSMHRQAPGAATRAIAAPLALTALATAIFTAPYPDGRSLVLTALASASQGIFWLLSTYTGLGFAFSLFQASDWRAAGLEAYSLERLQTLEIQGRSKLAGLLTPRSALKFTTAAVVLLIINSIRLVTEPPVVQIAIIRVVAAEKSIRLELQADDPAFRFHGFKPALFSLRSKSGYPVSTELTKASTEPDGDEVLLEMPETAKTSTALFLEFSTDRSKRDIQALQDLWLWYGFVPLKAIEKETLSPPQG